MEKSEVILSAALKLFVEYGFHGTPTSKIAAEAGVSNGTLFHYFKTKDELTVALYVHVKNDLNNALALRQQKTKDIRTRFKYLFADSIKWSLQNYKEFYYIQQFHFSPHLSLVSKEELERQTQLHLGLLQEAIDAKLLKPLPVELIIQLVGSQIYGLHQYLLEAKLTPAELQNNVDEALELLLTMIFI
ncbi:TetR/AcrR family transcriptional regulator [Pedobacter sp. L105]|uniref:TetR/AcrR family transcriptional regulator n=1 Tax=Pedobacter sp. L105 TaxID=1641871 RepID=UPI00131DCBFF|nr:TetR/AcrR family transcriptional regulator [Pedobacter sp. L105]